MAEDQPGEVVPVRQDVVAESDAYAAGRDMRARLMRVPVSGSQGIQAGEGNTQVNNYFLGEDPAARSAGAFVGTAAGRLLSDVTDPFALEVHQPVQADGQGSGLSVLPAYVSRGHDRLLSEVTQAAASGRSGIAVLVGGSSTGKTRACWEALAVLRGQPGPWRLWHPIDPSRPEAALRELPGIGPRTVVWLNEGPWTAPSFPEAVTSGKVETRDIKAVLHESGTTVAVVLGEAALRQQVGDVSVLRGQLRHLAALGRGGFPAVIQVVPFTAGVHGANGGFSVLEFGPAMPPGLVVVDGPADGGIYLDAPESVAAYAGAFTRLRELALSPQDSVRMLREAAHD